MWALLGLWAVVFFAAGAFVMWALLREPDPWDELERRR